MALCLSSYSHLSCLCMLLAINLSNLDLWPLKILPDGVQFQPSTISKQSRPSQSVTPFVFPSFPADKGSCPKETLIACMTRTESFRGSQTGNNRKTRLFLSYIWPHNLVTSSSIARWILSTLQSAGMDTTTFKACTLSQGCLYICSNFSRDNNQPDNRGSRLEFRIWFQRFYYKLCNSNPIGTAVLSTGSTDSLQKSCWYVIRVLRNVRNYLND